MSIFFHEIDINGQIASDLYSEVLYRSVNRMVVGPLYVYSVALVAYPTINMV